MDHSRAEHFAKDWIDSWNAHDLVRILSHYADDVVFHSPRIALVMKEPVDKVTGKPALERYWSQALSMAKDLHFTLDRVYAGSDSVTIAYRNHRGQSASETFIFNAQGLVSESVATYA